MRHRIASVSIHHTSPLAVSADIAAERHKAISDLIFENSFQLKSPAAAHGPYVLSLALYADWLDMQVDCQHSTHREELKLSLPPFRPLMRDYGIICDNFQKTAQSGQLYKLEAIDMGRRAVHNEAAELLIESLENKVILDKLTARRLFSLLYVLHIRNLNL